MNRFREMVRRIGERFGEYDDRTGAWHFREERNGCRYERKWDCCHVCFFRFVRYDIQLRREMQDRDPYPEADNDGEETSEFVEIEVSSPGEEQ